MRQVKEGSLKRLFQDYEKALTDCRRSRYAFRQDLRAIEVLRSKIKIRVREMSALDGIARSIEHRIQTWTPKE
jgi:tRNA C32,U32 (ribose-2'-O)-methylase TrmJ